MHHNLKIQLMINHSQIKKKLMHHNLRYDYVIHLPKSRNTKCIGIILFNIARLSSIRDQIIHLEAFFQTIDRRRLEDTNIVTHSIIIASNIRTDNTDTERIFHVNCKFGSHNYNYVWSFQFLQIFWFFKNALVFFKRCKSKHFTHFLCDHAGNSK